ncbi:MAG: GMC family oxidoreductase [Actinobacteria bacterium]|nr:GMC family oxidoreductase [Actinomycetota bacterium]
MSTAESPSAVRDDVHPADAAEVDVDVLVIGSGFGGAVTALRLAEKGYAVLVLEAGRRFADADFAKTSWDVKNYLWAPQLGCYGVQRIHRLPDVMILAGAGVGGGSLNYANTLYRPLAPFYRDPQWRDLADWEAELAPHYDTATRMLGVVQENPCEGVVEQVMREAAEEMGVGHTFRKTPVGVFLGQPGVTVPDPYFGGEGPDRTGCTMCGNCMVGCRVGAKNTLVKNYLALAERLGVHIEPLRTVTHLAEIPGTRGSDGRAAYRVRHEATDARGAAGARVTRARHVVVAAGTWGTQSLLHAMKETGDLPHLSDRLGHLTRTNSEALLGAQTERPPRDVDLTEGLAITSSFHPDEHTHIENVRYGRGSDAMGLLSTLLVPGDTGRPRPLEFLRQIVKNPEAARRSFPMVRRWSERIVIGLVMQPHDNSLRVFRKRGRLTSVQGHGEPNPSYIESGHRAMKVIADRLAKATGEYTVAGGSWGEVFDVPMTAHFLGGAVIGADASTGVVDQWHRVFGHPGISITDGSTISANLGVNPSLTITAQAERAMSFWPRKGEPDRRPVPASGV